MDDNNRPKWNWKSAIVGATAMAATAGIIFAKPRKPTFRLVSLTSLKLKLRNNKSNFFLPLTTTNNKINNELILSLTSQFPILSADLILTVHVTNPNILPVNYRETSMSIYYDGALLGSAEVPAGYQKPNSCSLLRLSARLDGIELGRHVKRFLKDVKKREMVLDAVVEIEGKAKAVLWDPNFKVHVDSHIVVDPILLNVIDQDNKTDLKFFLQ